MKEIIFSDINDLEAELSRPVQDLKKIKKVVKPILKKVKNQGDTALLKMAWEYDHAELDELLVSEEEIDKAELLISNELKDAIIAAKENITKFHEIQKQPEMVVETLPGVVCKRRSIPISKVGLYVPGGTAPLFSTVLMLAIPAKIAGCKEIVLCSPPSSKGIIHPAILFAAKVSGVNKIIKSGGAQAIAAMAYGTQSVPKVHKIFGPGNQYVTAAKMILNQKGVAIDMPAGPSEVLVYADESAIPKFVAADLLSQAEHGKDSQVVLVSSSDELIEKTKAELTLQMDELSRKHMASAAISNSCIVKVANDEEALETINTYAPEHLIISTKNAESVADKVENAGSIFIGNFTPESAGDYASGTNHTLPTYGAAVAYSGVSVDSFVKKITYQKIDPEGLKKIGPTVEIMAEAEELHAHKNAITLRLDYIKKWFSKN